MDEFIKLASKPEWWISVVFIGIAINLVSSGLGTILRKQLGHFVKSWGERNESLARERATKVERLSKSTHELYLAYLDLNQKRLDSLFDWILSGVLLGFGAAVKDTSSLAYSVSIIFAMLSAMQGLGSLIGYWQDAFLVQEAKFRNIASIKYSSSSKHDEPHDQTK